jgi:hypothetical protein
MIVKLNLFTILRLATCGGLLALLLVRAPVLPAETFRLFLAVILLWYLPTLGWRLIRLRPLSQRIPAEILFAILDTYLVLMTTAEVLAARCLSPFLLLGAYLFLVTLTAGVRTGAAAAVAGFFGLVNGWLLPHGVLQQSAILMSVATALLGVACGAFWRIAIPPLLQSVRGQRQELITKSKPRTEEQVEIGRKIAELERLLRTAGAERDQAQERLAEWEIQHPAPARPAPPPPLAPVIPVPGTPTPQPPPKGTPAHTPEDADNELPRLQQMEAELAALQAEKSALQAEKHALMQEVAGLTKELMAVYAPAPADGAPTPPAEKPI